MANEKRVLHLVEYLYQGGIERLLEQIFRHTPRDRARLSLFSYQTPALTGIAQEIQSLDVPLMIYDKTRRFDRQLHEKLSRLVKDDGIRTVHTHDFGPMEFALGIKLRRPSVQLIHTHHSLHYFLRFPSYLVFFQLAGLFYDKIICVSDHVRETLADRCPLIRSKLVTIPNGVDLAGFSLKPRPLSFPLRLITVCRISPEKNLIHILRALKDLRDRGVPFTWTHVGNGPDEHRQPLLDFAKNNALKEVTFAGFTADVKAALAGADVFVSSSLTEGHPVSVLEAMAAGMVTVVSDIPPHRQISESLVFFSLADNSLVDRLSAIAARPEAFLAVARKGREVVEAKYSLDTMINRYLELYRST
ncbi:MAG: glycosyltransferase family 4 protein [Deltaproteobacteria bacterium]|nr:glycosyltransferase family 4 protein [Deltaproteobacteria bacterium]MBI3295060.1 glycosyltransferase family 4 protein [Deltaproteobacteria bacterium]